MFVRASVIVLRARECLGPCRNGGYWRNARCIVTGGTCVPPICVEARYFYRLFQLFPDLGLLSRRPQSTLHRRSHTNRRWTLLVFEVLCQHPLDMSTITCTPELGSKPVGEDQLLTATT